MRFWRMCKVITLCAVLLSLLFLASCSKDQATVADLWEATESGDFYMEKIHDDLFYIYVDGGYTSDVQMAYISDTVRSLDMKYHIVDVALVGCGYKIMSPVIVIVGDEK